MKTNLPEIMKAYLGSAAFFTIAGEGAMALAYTYDLLRQPHILLPLAVGFGLPALPFGFYLAARVTYLSRPPERASATRPAYTSFSHSAAWVAPQPKAPPGLWFFDFFKGPTKTVTYRPEPRQEFIFWEAGMASMITEFRLFSFCRIAWRRQQQMEFGNLGSNQIFSRDYYVSEVRPRFPKPDYRSIMHILKSRDLLINRWQGKGGQLRYPPYSTVQEAKLRWGFPVQNPDQLDDDFTASTGWNKLDKLDQVQSGLDKLEQVEDAHE